MLSRKHLIGPVTFLFSVLILSLLVSPFRAEGESEGDRVTQKFLNNVVQLTVTFSDDSIEHGFGFVVGERRSTLYVVTANHVVRTDDPNLTTEQVQTRFYAEQGRSYSAELLELAYKGLDLALLAIPNPFADPYTWEEHYFALPRQGRRVWFIGRNQEWWVPVAHETGIIQDPPILSAFSVRMVSVLPGTSGAPLVTEEGIVGMIVEDNAEGIATALNIKTIHQVVTGKWGYPWQLQEAPSSLAYLGETPEQREPLNTKLVVQLLKTLDEQEVALAEREQEIQRWVKEYHELEERYNKGASESPLFARAKEKFDTGEWEEAERLFQESLRHNLQAMDERHQAAASDALELGVLKELQFDYVEAKTYYEQAVQLDPEHPDGWTRLGHLLYRRGQLQDAEDAYQHVLALAESEKNEKLSANTYGYLGRLYSTRGQQKQAITYYEQALAIHREIGDRQGEGTWLGNLGNVYYELGQVERAITYYEQALAIHKETGYRQGEGDCLGNLGLSYSRLGQVEQAITYYEQALAIHRETGSRLGEGIWLCNLGEAYQMLGKMEQAIEYRKQGLAIHKEMGYREAEGSCLCGLGFAYYESGQPEQAITYYEQALAIDKEIGYRQGEGGCLGNLGLAYKELGQVERAITYYEQALAIHKEIGYREGEGTWLGDLGSIYYELGQLEKALDYYQQQLVIVQEMGHRYGEGNALWGLGITYKALNNTKKAKQCLQESLAIFEEIKSPSADSVRKWLAGFE